MDFSFFENLTKEEPLHDDLMDFFEEEEESCFSMIRHPLVYAVPYIPQMNHLYNKQYLAKSEARDKAFKEENWSQYIWLHERPYRVEAFCEIESYMDDKAYFELLGSIWSDSENIGRNLDLWKELLFETRFTNQEYFMDEKEREAFNKLPDQLTIYRGHQGVNKDGLSWTLSQEKAEWFANRFSADGKVVSKTIAKDQIFAYLSGRNEEEIIIKL